MAAAPTISLTIHEALTGSFIDMVASPSTEVKTIIAQTLEKMGEHEPWFNFYLHDLDGNKLENHALLSACNLMSGATLKLKKTTKAKLGWTGQPLPSNVVAVKEHEERNSNPELDAFEVDAGIKVITAVPPEIIKVAPTIGSTQAISLSAIANPRDPVVSHVELHLAGDEKDFDQNEFKQAIAADLGLADPNDVVVLSVRPGGSFFVKFCLKLKAAAGAALEELQAKAKEKTGKLHAYVVDINNKNEEKFAHLQAAAAHWAKDKVKSASELGAKFAKKWEPKTKFDFEQQEQLIEMTQLVPLNSEEAKQWLKGLDADLEKAMLSMLQRSHGEYVVQDVTLLLNDQLQQQFAERCGSRPSRMLFHGTKTQHFASIFEQGFIFKAQTDSGYFGQGYYFSSFPEYALSYSHQSCSANKPVHLIASYVCLGKSYEVKDMSFQGNPQLKPGYDSHYVRVVGPHFYPLAMNPEYKGSYPVYDEYVVTEK